MFRRAAEMRYHRAPPTRGLLPHLFIFRRLPANQGLPTHARRHRILIRPGRLFERLRLAWTGPRLFIFLVLLRHLPRHFTGDQRHRFRAVPARIRPQPAVAHPPAALSPPGAADFRTDRDRAVAMFAGQSGLPCNLRSRVFAKRALHRLRIQPGGIGRIPRSVFPLVDGSRRPRL